MKKRYKIARVWHWLWNDVALTRKEKEQKEKIARYAAHLEQIKARHRLCKECDYGYDAGNDTEDGRNCDECPSCALNGGGPYVPITLDDVLAMRGDTKTAPVANNTSVGLKAVEYIGESFILVGAIIILPIYIIVGTTIGMFKKI